MTKTRSFTQLNKVELIKKIGLFVLFIMSVTFVFMMVVEEGLTTKAAVNLDDYGNEHVFMGNFNNDFYPIPSQANPANITLTIDQYISLTEFQTEFGVGSSFVAPTLPYNKTIRIDTGLELYKLSVAANSVLLSGNEANFYLQHKYVLGNNIDYFSQATAGNLFMPIGTPSYLVGVTNVSAKPFIGTFDGQGFEISNLIFGNEENLNLHAANRGVDTSFYDSIYTHFGMFAEVGSAGVIKNIGLVNPIIAITSKPDNLVYVTALVGKNAGTLEYSYVVDNRSSVEAGYDAWGGFQISGVVGTNTSTGVINNIFYSGIRVVTQNVGNLYSSRPVIMENTGTVTEAYYDTTIYIQDDPGFIYYSNELPPLMNGDNLVVVPKTTSELNQRTNILLNSRWFTRETGLPKLRGFIVDAQSSFSPGTIENPYIIGNESSFIYFVDAINGIATYRDRYFRFNQSMNMYKVSSSAFRPITANFTGVLSGKWQEGEPLPYSYTNSTMNSTKNHAIIGLNMTSGVIFSLNYYAGLFVRLSGEVRNLNLINGSISLNNTGLYTNSEFFIGAVAATLTGGKLIDVHSNTTINLGTQAIGKISVGGLVGAGYGELERVSNTGDVIGGIHPFVNAAATSQNAVAGLFGRSTTVGYLDMSHALNTGKVEGASFTGTLNFTGALPVVVGGLVGVARTNYIAHVANKGAVYTAALGSPSTNRVHEAYIGGVFGQYVTHVGSGVLNAIESQLGAYNSGHIYNQYTTGKVRAAGVANVKSASVLTLHKLTNSGIYYQNTNTGAHQFAGVVYDELSGTNLLRAYNFASFSFVATTNNPTVYPIYYMEPLAGVFPTLTEVINYGDISLTSVSSTISTPLYISGITPQNTVNINKARNYGNISVTASSLATGGINIGGITREINNNISIQNVTNEGSITYLEATGYNPTYQIKIGGIVSEVLRSVTLENGLPVTGSIYLKNVVNNGYVQVKTRTSGLTSVGGITGVNDGFIRDAANLGNVHAMNESTAAVLAIEAGYSGVDVSSQPATTHLVYVGGIAGNNRLSVSRVYDSVNYGEIVGYNKYDVSVGGLVGDSPDKLSIIRYSINYGNVYSYATTPTQPTTGFACTPSNQGNGTTCRSNGYFMSRARSGGIAGSGRLSLEKVVNRGLIASNDTAAGLVGLMYFRYITDVTGTTYQESINYGTVRYIASMSTSFVPSTPTSTLPANINVTSHVNTSNGPGNTWQVRNMFAAFVGNLYVSPNDIASSSYPVPEISFRYLLNTDSVVDVIGRMPPSVSINPAPEGTNWTMLENSTKTIASTKTTDSSQFLLNRWSYVNSTLIIATAADRWIKRYTNDTAAPNIPTSYGGIYHPDFFMRTGTYTDPNGNPATVPNYNEYIAYYQNEFLADYTKNLSVFTTGMYVLASSEGQTNGAFMPANINLMSLDMVDPYKNCQVPYDGYNEGSGYCEIWRDIGDPVDSTKVNYKFDRMYQLKYSIASSIFNLELVATSGTRLTAPSIDLYNKTITYTISNNFFNGLAGTSTDFNIVDSTVSLSVSAALFGGTMHSPIDKNTYTINLSHTIPGSNQYGPHYVNVRSESSLYSNPSNPVINEIVASDYAIYINVTGASSLTRNAVPLINGSTTTFTDVSSSIIQLNTQLPTTGGSLEISYTAVNIPVGYDIYSKIEVRNSTNQLVSPALYEFYRELVNNTYGSVYLHTAPSTYYLRYRMIFSETLPAGNYFIYYTVYGVNYEVRFTKTASALSNITNINHEYMDNLSINTTTKTIQSTVLFGTLLDYFNATSIIDGVPSYLDEITISSNASVTSYTFVGITTSGIYKTYQMTIRITAESGAFTDWTHYITERTVVTTLRTAYQNGATILTSNINFDRELGYMEFEAEYNDQYFHAKYDHIILVNAYKDSSLLSIVDNNVYDAFNNILLSVGVDKDNVDVSYAYAYFQDLAQPGIYEFEYFYQDVYQMPGSSTVLINSVPQTEITWNVELETLQITKNLGKNTYLQNITFSSVGLVPRYPIIRSKEQYENPLQPITVAIYANRIYYNEIITTGASRVTEFYVEGYVRGSDLTAYAPTFPVAQELGGATVGRCIELPCTVDKVSSNLVTDFSQVGDDITWITYRVVSEDEQFITYYHISVIDVEYNVSFKFNIYYTTKSGTTFTIVDPPSSFVGEIFPVTFRNLQTNRPMDNYSIAAFTTVNGVLNQMTSAAYLTGTSPSFVFTRRQFETNTSGDYNIRIDLPKGYNYTVFKSSLELERFDSLDHVTNYISFEGYYYYVIPTVRGSYHELTFYIYEETVVEPWGFSSIWKFFKEIFN